MGLPTRRTKPKVGGTLYKSLMGLCLESSELVSILHQRFQETTSPSSSIPSNNLTVVEHLRKQTHSHLLFSRSQFYLKFHDANLWHLRNSSRGWFREYMRLPTLTFSQHQPTFTQQECAWLVHLSRQSRCEPSPEDLLTILTCWNPHNKEALSNGEVARCFIAHARVPMQPGSTAIWCCRVHQALALFVL